MSTKPMYIWITQDGEPLPEIDRGTRDWRCGLLAKTLVENGHQVLWWASNFDHFNKEMRFEKPRTVKIRDDLNVRFLAGPGYMRNKSFQRYIHNKRLAEAFQAEAEECVKPDIIFASLPTIELAEKAVAYGLENNVPVLVDIRDLWPDHYLTLLPPGLRWLGRLALYPEFQRVRRLLIGATGIVSISKTFLEWGLQNADRTIKDTDGVFMMGYPKLSIPRNKILLRKKQLILEYGIIKNTLKILFVGSVNSIFDFDTVLEAARHCERFGKPIQFIIVGDGTNFSEVQRSASGISNVVFTGRLDQVTVAAMIELSHVGLAPYAEGKSISGSLPNKAFEYMSFGLPILSSHQGDLAKLIQEHRIGFHYQVGNFESLIEKINYFIDKQEERVAMGKRSRKLFEERYHANKIYQEMVQHMESIAIHTS